MYWKANYGTDPMEQVHTMPHVAEITSQTKTLCIVAALSMLTYLLIQVMGHTTLRWASVGPGATLPSFPLMARIVSPRFLPKQSQKKHRC